jgi:hypothetical protein
MIGKEKLEIYEVGYKYNGPKFSETSYPHPSGDVVTTYEGDEAVRQYWFIHFNEMSDTDKKFIEAVFPGLYDGLNNPEKVRRIGMPKRLIGVSVARLAKAEVDFLVKCNRCGGSGKYSFNYRDGSTCYGCNGIGKKLPKITNKWLDEVATFYRERYQAGQ